MFIGLGLVIITALLRVSICCNLIMMASDAHLLDVDVVEVINKIIDQWTINLVLFEDPV